MVKESLSVLLILGLIIGSTESVFSLQLPDPSQEHADHLRPAIRKDQASPWQDAPSNDVVDAFISYDGLVVFPMFGTLVFKGRAKHSVKTGSPAESPIRNRAK